LQRYGGSGARGGGRGLRCGGVAAWHEVCSALFVVEPEFGSEVKIEAWRRTLIQQTLLLC